MQLDFQSGMTIPVTLASEWVFVEAATNKIEIQIEATGERIKLGQQALFKSTTGLLGRCLITASGVVELEHGIGEFTPSIEGQSLVVSSIPPMEIAAGQQVIVSQLPAINVAPGQQIAVNALPNIVLADGQQVGVVNMPDMTIAEKQYVRIESMPVMKVAANQQIGIKRSAVLATSEVSVFPHDIASNSDRQKLIIKAPATNTAAVMIGAYGLDAGEKLEIESTAAIAITGSAGDTLHIMEW